MCRHGRSPVRPRAPRASAGRTRAAGSRSRCSTRRTHAGRARRARRRVPPSVATTRSSSVLALAIHVTSCCSRSPRRAVTRPPPPRRSIRAPCSSRSYETGPRFETTISGRLSGTSDRDDVAVARVSAGQLVEEHQPVAQEPRRQEVPAHVLLALERAPRAPRPGRAGSRCTPRRTPRSSRRASPSLRFLSGQRSRPHAPRPSGRAFQSASVTVSPKPSFVDFCSAASECTWKAFTSTPPTLFMLLRM